MSLPRYPEYKEREVKWLGELPRHWQVMRLAWAATVNDETLSEATSPDFEMAYVDIGSVSLDYGIERTERLTFSIAPSRARRVVRDGDVLISTVRTYLKAIAPVSTPPENMIVSTGFAVIRPKSKLHTGFAKFVLQTDGFVDEVISRSTGVSYPTISAPDLVRISIPLPPIEEQSAVAAFLDYEVGKIDALIVEQERLIALMAEKYQVIISHAVTRGLNPEVPMKESGVAWMKEVPAHWTVAKLGHFATVENGTTPSRSVDGYWEGGDVPWLASGEVNQRQITEASEFITRSALESCSLRLLPVGTVVVGMIGQGKTRGMSAMLCIPAAINQNLAAICPGQSIEGSYILYILHAVYQWLREAGRGGNQAAMNCEMLATLRIPVPPVKEQRSIVSFVEVETTKLDGLRVEAERAISLLRARRSALISAAVTGQIDVRAAQQLAEEQEAMAA